MSEFKGLVTSEIAADLYEDHPVFTEIEKITFPQVESWRIMPEKEGKLYGQYAWTIRPPGVWVSVIRYEDVLIITNDEIPMSVVEAVDWGALYLMLRYHKATLFSRLHPDYGLIGIAAKQFDEPALPLLPGFTATTDQDLSQMDAKGVEMLIEQQHDWPGGLLAPSVLFVQQANSLKNPEHRASWIQKCPEGLWLMGVIEDELKIYEVLA